MTRYMLINELIIQSELNLHSMKIIIKEQVVFFTIFLKIKLPVI